MPVYWSRVPEVFGGGLALTDRPIGKLHWDRVMLAVCRSHVCYWPDAASMNPVTVAIPLDLWDIAAAVEEGIPVEPLLDRLLELGVPGAAELIEANRKA